MVELAYSIDSENFDFTDLDEAVYTAINNSLSLVPGDCVFIYVGEVIHYLASDFVGGYIIDSLADNAFGCHTSDQIDWPNCNTEQELELIENIKRVVDEWATSHNLQPTFYGIKNVKQFEIKFISENDCGEYQYEVVSPISVEEL